MSGTRLPGYIQTGNFDTRHEKFAQLIAGGVKPLIAYKNAGFHCKNDDVGRASASRIKRRMQWRIAQIAGIMPVAPDPETSPESSRINLIVQETIKLFQKDVPWCREKLHELINDKEIAPAVRLSAIKECLNRGMGLPVQYVEQNLNVRYQISDRELTEEEWFARYAKPVEALPGPTEPTEH
jgi:hypothetical protein